ncbi:hypothetical protein NMY22_g8954 [Coprinellus aureogranulatus]|nr:hypothetical protein NMY22_g8954 [Coprinellus aureogranulatus]
MKSVLLTWYQSPASSSYRASHPDSEPIAPTEAGELSINLNSKPRFSVPSKSTTSTYASSLELGARST